MGSLIKVVDDYYPDPDLVRELALRSTYGIQEGYVGYRSTRGYVPRGAVEKLKAAFGLDRVILQPESGGATCFFHTLASGELREAFHAHIDCTRSVKHPLFNFVVYLTPGAPKDTGTGIYRHKETGIWQDPTRDDARKLGRSRTEIRAWLRREAGDPSRWELLEAAENVYNRGVFFPSHWYHTGARYFGDRIENGRLYQAFFFEAHPYVFDL
jgi:hypothetical protein